MPLVLIWHPFHESSPADASMPKRPFERSDQWWQEWSSKCTYQGPWRRGPARSLITLKALTYAPTGGILAAADDIASGKNRRRAELGLPLLLGPRRHVHALRPDSAAAISTKPRPGRTGSSAAVAGTPSQLNIMYGLAGERRLQEFELDWLSGYEGSRPVRIGNAAHRQFQLDVFGEVMERPPSGPPAWHAGRRKRLAGATGDARSPGNRLARTG